MNRGAKVVVVRGYAKWGWGHSQRLPKWEGGPPAEEDKRHSSIREVLIMGLQGC